MWLTNLLQNAWYLFLVLLLICLSVICLSVIETAVSAKIQELKTRRYTKKAIKSFVKAYESQLLKEKDDMLRNCFNVIK